MSGGTRRPVIGLALGAGASHGWAHIGVIRGLEDAGVVPDIICGCSSGALVGACHAAGELDFLEKWVRNLTVRRTIEYMRVRRGRSLFGERLLREMLAHFRGLVIEDLPRPFAAVATDLETGREISVRSGPLARAVAASGAFPLLFPPVKIKNRWAVDGCLVNPVPVSTCRALGADIVIAVRVLDLGERLRAVSEAGREAALWSRLLVGTADGLANRWANVAASVARRLNGLRRSENRACYLPGTFSLMRQSVVAQRALRHSEAAPARADIQIEPRLGRLVLGTDGAVRAIAAGRSAANQILGQLEPLVRPELARRHRGNPG